MTSIVSLETTSGVTSKYMLFGSKKVIGLDIGTSSIKMAEMEVGRNQAQLLSFGFAPTPPNSLNGGEISNPGAISSAIQQLMFEVKSKRKHVSTGMWGTAVIVKKITIPRIEKKMIRDQIRWEAEQYIPFDINNISLAYHIIADGGGGDTMDLLLIAAQSELVSQYTTAISGAGLQTGVLDVSGFALANVFEMNYGKLFGETIGLLDIGAGVTNFVVVSSGDVIFSRDVPVGGFNYTNEIHKEMSITLQEAESMKLSAVGRGAVPDEVHSILSATNDVITEEIRNSFEFFSGSNNGMVLNRCYVTGGSSGIPGLMEQISKSTGVACEYMNPFMKIRGGKQMNEGYLQQVAPFASVAMGLGLRKVGDS